MHEPTFCFVTQVAPYRDGPAGSHGVLEQAATAMSELAELAGLGFRRVADVRMLPAADIASCSVVALFTIGETPWSPEQRDALLSTVRGGSAGILAVHSATDSCHTWDAYGDLVGGRFAGHPWTCSTTLDVHEPDHPAMAPFGTTLEWHDEIYLFSGLRPDARVLLTARPDELEPPSGPEADAVARADRARGGYPLAWCFTEGKGRVFYSALGHFPLAWETPTYLRHLAGGLRWITTPEAS